MAFRWVEWQQAMLIIAPFVLLFAYIVWVYLLVRGRSRRSSALRLLAAASAFTLIWSLLAYLLFFISWIGTSDVSIEYQVREETYRRTIALPFYILEAFPQVPGQLQTPAWLGLTAALLALGALVDIAQRILAHTSYAIEERRQQYLGALGSAVVAALAILLWPQPSRNPEMR